MFGEDTNIARVQPHQASGDDMESDGNDRDGDDNNGFMWDYHLTRMSSDSGRAFWSELSSTLCLCQDINDASNTLSSL